jgi:hypothetical protein
MFDPVKILRDEWPVIQGAPWLTVGLGIIVLVCTWWVTKQFTKGEIAGQKAQRAARDERLLWLEKG